MSTMILAKLGYSSDFTIVGTTADITQAVKLVRHGLFPHLLLLVKLVTLSAPQNQLPHGAILRINIVSLHHPDAWKSIGKQLSARMLLLHISQTLITFKHNIAVGLGLPKFKTHANVLI